MHSSHQDVLHVVAKRSSLCRPADTTRTSLRGRRSALASLPTRWRERPDPRLLPHGRGRRPQCDPMSGCGWRQGRPTRATALQWRRLDRSAPSSALPLLCRALTSHGAVIGLLAGPTPAPGPRPQLGQLMHQSSQPLLVAPLQCVLVFPCQTCDHELIQRAITCTAALVGAGKGRASEMCVIPRRSIDKFKHRLKLAHTAAAPSAAPEAAAAAAPVGRGALARSRSVARIARSRSSSSVRKKMRAPNTLYDSARKSLAWPASRLPRYSSWLALSCCVSPRRCSSSEKSCSDSCGFPLRAAAEPARFSCSASFAWSSFTLLMLSLRNGERTHPPQRASRQSRLSPADSSSINERACNHDSRRPTPAASTVHRREQTQSKKDSPAVLLYRVEPVQAVEPALLSQHRQNEG